MTRTVDADSGSPGEAAKWFVRLDAGDARDADAAVAAWLAAAAENARAFERVELAVELGRRLAADPERELHAEMLRVTRVTRPYGAGRAVGRGLGWFSAAAAVLAAVWIGTRPEPKAPVDVRLQAARLVAIESPTNPVVLLPNGVVVDAGAVALLPFSATGDATLAQGLERDIATALRTVPGLYVISGVAVSPYTATELTAAEIGAQLGARGLVDATVELANGRVRVSATLRESATGAVLWQIAVDEPVDALRGVRDELAERIAATMLDGELRARPNPFLAAYTGSFR